MQCDAPISALDDIPKDTKLFVAYFEAALIKMGSTIYNCSGGL